jgi:hypothetical protein
MGRCLGRRLVGRQRELAAVARFLDRGRDGHGGQLLITGPPGVGRTALLRAAADLADDRGVPVSWLTPDAVGLAIAAADGPRLLLAGNLGRPPGIVGSEELERWLRSSSAHAARSSSFPNHAGRLSARLPVSNYLLDQMSLHQFC